MKGENKIPQRAIQLRLILNILSLTSIKLKNLLKVGSVNYHTNEPVAKFITLLRNFINPLKCHYVQSPSLKDISLRLHWTGVGRQPLHVLELIMEKRILRFFFVDGMQLMMNVTRYMLRTTYNGFYFCC